MKMKSTSLLPFYLSLAATIACLTQHVSAQCYRPSDPFNRNKLIPVACEMVQEEVKDPTVNQITQGNMFQIDFTCGTNDTVACQKAKAGFEGAGQIISSVLKLSAPIIVKAAFLDFCKVLNECPVGNLTVLGQAGPTQFAPIKDDDGVTRLYPQALVKQLGLSSHPAFATSDIDAQFNSGFPNFWFKGDKTPLAATQVDFQYVILHELIHGLGFVSSWTEYLFDPPKALTPSPEFSTANPPNYVGFQEFGFDKHMILLGTGQSMTKITAELNQFTSTAKISTIEELATAFSASPQFKIAQDMMTKAITAKSFGFLPNGTTDPANAVILETSLNPFRSGSSVSHVDNATYITTPDFIMAFKAIRGKSLDEIVKSNGGGPIGPKLQSVLETLGYKLASKQANTTNSTAETSDMNTNNQSQMAPGPSVNYGSTGSQMVPNMGFVFAVAVASWIVGRRDATVGL